MINTLIYLFKCIKIISTFTFTYLRHGLKILIDIIMETLVDKLFPTFCIVLFFILITYPVGLLLHLFPTLKYFHA